MNDYEAIRRLIALYGQLLDSRRFEEWSELFVEDAEFRVWGNTYRGRDVIRSEIGGMQPDTPVKHVALQPVIELLDDDHAICWTDFCGVGSGEGTIEIVTIARYHDRLVRRAEDGRWRFQQRVIVMGGEDVPEDVVPSPAF